MSLGSALQIGRSAVLAYQSALQIVGQNIANAGNPAYSRLAPELASIPILGAGGGVNIGNGVRIAGIQRNVAEAVEARLLTGRSNRQAAQAKSDSLARMEAVINALGENNLGSQLEKFFRAWGELQNAPESIATRRLVLSTGAGLADSIRQARSDLVATHGEANEAIETLVSRVNQLTTQIGDLNVQVVSSEASGGTAGPLRDQRDDLIRQLADLVGVTTRDQPGGAVNVYVGNDPIVLFGESRDIQAVTVAGPNDLQSADLKFVDNNGPLTLRSGQIAGLIEARDENAAGQIARLDQLATSLIFEVNKVHAQGQGLRGYASLTGGYAVDDATAALNSSAAGLPFSPKSGAFYVDVTDTATGTTVRRQITIDLDGVGADTTLNSLAAQITANVPNLTASALAGGTLQLTATTGFTFTFAEDTSGALAALGLNTFFSGETGVDITIAAGVSDSPELLAAATSGLPGDGKNAGNLAKVLETAVNDLGGATLGEFYGGSVSIHAVSAAAAGNELQAADAILSSLTAQRESVSGVNLDEEAIRMVTYQRAFEGAARYLATVDQMLQTLLNLAR